MEMKRVSMLDCIKRVSYLAPHVSRRDTVYGVPRGGVTVAALMVAMHRCTITDNPQKATLIVDDIIDSGATRDRYKRTYPTLPFLALYDKTVDTSLPWMVFPWEESDQGETSTEDIFTRLLQYIGEDTSRQGLKDTPKRMAKAWKEWTSGYAKNPMDLVTVFEDGAQGYDEMVLMKDIPFYSHCEHHLAPFFGTASVAYIPEKNSVLGISKLGRIVDIYAKRLQIQERMTTQIANTIDNIISPLGVAVVLKARHLCTESRGLSKQGHVTVTSAMRGVFKDNPETRNEFMLLIK